MRKKAASKGKAAKRRLAAVPAAAQTSQELEEQESALEGDFVEDWMEEQGVRRGEEWDEPGFPRPGDFCDVRLKDGTEMGPFAPHADVFVRIDGVRRVPLSEVTHVRYYEQKYGRAKDEKEPEDEGEDGGDDGRVDRRSEY